MEKVKRFFRNFNEKRSYQIVFFVVSMCVILSGYFVLREKIERQYSVAVDRDLVKCIEEVYNRDGKLIINGWCLYKECDSRKNQVQVFLRNVENVDDIVWMNVKNTERLDVDNYFGGGGTDYRFSGFQANIKLNELNIDVNNYEIFIKLSYVQETVRDGEEFITGGKRTVSTGQYICGGELTTICSDQENKLDKSSSEKLNEVFEKGRLLTYREESDIYIYQYQDKLYWVAGNNFLFDENNVTTIQYHLETTRKDLLPIGRRELGWDNLGFIFEEHEITESDCFPYRIAVRDIPKEYPVTCVRTGYVEGDNWVWKEELNIDIRTK